MSSENNRGIVLCFLIYIVLCATIVSIIERPWLIVPQGTPMNIDLENLPQSSQQNSEAKALSNVTFDAAVPGYCGVSGVCFPFKDGSPLIQYYSNEGTAQCERIDPILVFTNREDFMRDLNIVHHVPLYLCIAGSVFLLFTWVVGICSCCNESCGYCTIYSVIAIMLTFSTSVFLAGALTFFIFGDDKKSCVKRICGEVSSAFDFGHCKLGWSTFVAAGGLLFGYIVAILSCVLATKTPLSRQGKANQVIEVKPAPRRAAQMMTSRA